jgi:hypothetical protein
MKILSVCGGGVWGYGSAHYLHQMSKLGIEASTSFDAFAGTSVGAIIATALAAGVSSEDILNLFEMQTKNIFTKHPLWKRLWPTVPRYDNKHIKTILTKMFGSMRLHELKKPCYITAWRTNGKNRNKVWGPRDTDKVVDVVMASAAAPTYFSPVVIGKEEFLDGGLWANNPALCALTDAYRLFIPENIKCLTLMTGGISSGQRLHEISHIEIGRYLLKNMITGAETGNDYIVKSILRENAFTVAPDVSNYDIGLDAVDKMSTIRQLWVSEFNRSAKELEAWFEK